MPHRFKLEKDLDLMNVAEKCPNNLTGADLYALCADAMLNCMRRKITALETGMYILNAVKLFESEISLCSYCPMTCMGRNLVLHLSCDC